LAEGAGFEPAVGLPTTAFKAVPIGRSGTPPRAAPGRRTPRDSTRAPGAGGARGEIVGVTTETATVHRLAPAVAARLLGVVLCLVAVVILASTLAIAVLDLHTVFLLVPVLLTVAVLVGCWWAWRTRGWVVRMTTEGYRVQWVRGVGVASGRWKDVEDAVTTTVAQAPVVVLRLRDGRTTTIPVQMLAVDREAFVRDIQDHLQRGHGLRKL
jgi:hypothetical protein